MTLKLNRDTQTWHSPSCIFEILPANLRLDEVSFIHIGWSPGQVTSAAPTTQKEAEGASEARVNEDQVSYIVFQSIQW
jgi:hypothetical protein